jgi:hypothetical protein
LGFGKGYGQRRCIHQTISKRKRKEGLGPLGFPELAPFSFFFLGVVAGVLLFSFFFFFSMGMGPVGLMFIHYWIGNSGFFFFLGGGGGGVRAEDTGILLNQWVKYG